MCQEIFERDLPALEDSLADKFIAGATSMEEVRQKLSDAWRCDWEQKKKQATMLALIDALADVSPMVHPLACRRYTTGMCLGPEEEAGPPCWPSSTCAGRCEWAPLRCTQGMSAVPMRCAFACGDTFPPHATLLCCAVRSGVPQVCEMVVPHSLLEEQGRQMYGAKLIELQVRITGCIDVIVVNVIVVDVAYNFSLCC